MDVRVASLTETQHLNKVDNMEYNGFLIEGDGTFGYKQIKPVGRGSVPKQLRGKYTTALFAQSAIDAYLITKKGKANVSTESTS